ncbi:TetR/AcrR family transcriptional regulator [Pseudonocardia spinosispora]|uniref:TetR/AcrR family transcriptional regulator n=1 Tax=Pseudonocardia spinosispora TaxID=103441 RepID=UPI000403F45E|nr:TetR/AcrR family transcriptional regulator [Pseudonocardia spinosispora]
MTKADARRPRLRRSSEEVRGLLDAAASRHFGKNGYAGTSTRAIASTAGVSETLLFRHFGTKSALFEETLLRRFQAAVDTFVTTWGKREVPQDGDEAHARKFIKDMLKLYRNQRGAIFALMSINNDDAEVRSIFGAAVGCMDQLLDCVREHVLTGPGGKLYPGVDPRVSASTVIAVVLSVTVLDQWLFESGVRKPAAVSAVDEEAIDYILHGIGHR